MKFSLDPITKAEITIKLYRNVKNTKQLRVQLMDGTLKACMAKPRMIVDRFAIVQAANKALCAEKMITKSVYTEILYNLSISKNITQSLQLFGIDDADTDLLVVSVHEDAVFERVDGDEVDLNELGTLRDVNAIKKAYKLTEIEVENSLVDSVCNKIVIKDFL